MRQAVMASPGSIEINEVDKPEPREGEVLVKVMSIGVCGSDVHVYHGLHPYTSYPVVQGHEASCVVEKSGPGVSGFDPGTRVTIEPQVSCGQCYSCRTGLYNICDKLKVIGFQTTGCASDYYIVPADKLVELDLPLPAYEQVLKASHTFNLLDARRAISVTERQRFILRVRNLSRKVAEVYFSRREALGFPGLMENTGE